MNQFLRIALGLLAFAASTQADVIFSDSEFSNNNWELITYANDNGGETTATRIDSGGNPGAYRSIETSVVAGGRSLVFGFHRRVGALYTPASQGAIDHIDYSESSAIFVDSGIGGLNAYQITGPALRQDGQLYFHSLSTHLGPDWRLVEAECLRATDFAYFDAARTNTLDGSDNTRHPDFTTNGAPLEVGFFRAKTGAQGSASAYAETFVGGIDNWSLAIRSPNTTNHCGQFIAQQAYLKASKNGVQNYFGWSVGISGDTMVVGAFGEGSNATGVNGNQTNNSAVNSGAAYVFVQDGGSWVQQAYLKASNTGANDGFGSSVAISGNTIVVGAGGESSNATGVNGDQTNNSAVNSGAAYVFVRNGTNWSQQAYLKASNTAPADYFGFSVAISGYTVLVGAPGEDSNATGVNGNQSNNSAAQSGAAYVFVRDGTNWSQQAYLKASNTGGPSSPSDLVFGDQFGYAVALSGDTLAVAAYTEDSNATGVNGEQTNNKAQNSGAAYVFMRNGTNWNQQAYLKASNTGGPSPGDDAGDGDSFGYTMGISGDTIVVVAPGEDSIAKEVNGDQSDNSLLNSGAAYVFVRDGTNWSQQAYLKASNADANDQFGDSVAISGNTIVVGVVNESSNATGVNGNQTNNSAVSSGAAYVFVRDGTNWSQQAYLKASNTGGPSPGDVANEGDGFGMSVALSGDTVVVGAALEDSNAAGVNGNQTNNSALNSGAAYVFTGLGSLAPEIGLEQYEGILRIFWPSMATSFVLEEADEISTSPAAWTQIPFPYQTNAAEISITSSQTTGNRFYRLRKP